MNDRQPPPTMSMKHILDQTTQELNKADAAKALPPAAQVPAPDRDVGEAYAKRYRDAAEKTAMAIEAQAEERMRVALELVEQAKEHVVSAKRIADDVRKGAEDEAQRAIVINQRLQESTQMLVALRDKHNAEI
jgi:hypothetical protein